MIIHSSFVLTDVLDLVFWSKKAELCSLSLGQHNRQTGFFWLNYGFACVCAQCSYFYFSCSLLILFHKVQFYSWTRSKQSMWLAWSELGSGPEHRIPWRGLFDCNPWAHKQDLVKLIFRRWYFRNTCSSFYAQIFPYITALCVSLGGNHFKISPDQLRITA